MAAKVFSHEELRLVADAALRFDAYVICDEVYEHLVFDGARHATVLAQRELAEPRAQARWGAKRGDARPARAHAPSSRSTPRTVGRGVGQRRARRAPAADARQR